MLTVGDQYGYILTLLENPVKFSHNPERKKELEGGSFLAATLFSGFLEIAHKCKFMFIRGVIKVEIGVIRLGTRASIYL